MSKGHGRVQRAILAELRTPEWTGEWTAELSGWVSVEELAARLREASGAATVFGPYGDDPADRTRAEIESVRRAVKKLALEGLVEVKKWDVAKTRPRRNTFWSDKPVWTRQWMLHARRVPTAEFRAAELLYTRDWYVFRARELVKVWPEMAKWHLDEAKKLTAEHKLPPIK
ncbi:MAG TPA: hypothetical protein VGQ92_17905 [Actinoplanes sp.]|jgi:hypothetical protein|nr:hypothetical protein [Actinoplanes sp.]